MIDFLRKNKISMDDLPKLVEQLPSLGGVVTKKQEETKKQEDNTHEQASNHPKEHSDSDSE